MKKLKLLWFSIIAVLLSLMISAIAVFFNSSLKPELCADLCVSDDIVYGIDYQGENQLYHIYKCGIDGKKAVSINQKAEKDNHRYVYDKITYDSVMENAYVHLSEFACDTGLLKSEMVLKCDFENMKLIPMWEILFDEDNLTSSSAMTFFVRNNILYYLSQDSENEYKVHEQRGISQKVIAAISCFDDTVFSKYQFDKNGKLYAFSTTGGLYLEDEKRVLQPITGKNNSWDSYANPAFGESDAACLDLVNQKQILYSQDNNVLKENDILDSFSKTFIEGEKNELCNISYDMLTNHCLLKDGGFVAYSEIPDIIGEEDSFVRSGLAVYKNDTMTLYPYISYGKSYMIQYFTKWLGITLACLALIIIILYIIYFLFKGKQYVSVLIETTLFSALLFGGAIGFTSFIINQIMTDSFNKSYQEVFDDLEQEICCEMDSLISQAENFSEKVLFSEDFHQKLYNIMQNTSIKNPMTGKEEFAPYFVFHGLNSDNQLIVLYNSSGKEQIPTSYIYNNFYINNQYGFVLKEHVDRNLTQYDTEGIWNVQLCPYENEEYNVNGVVEIGIDQYLTDWKTRNITNGIVKFVLILCTVMVVIIIIFLGFSFLPIRKLGKQVEKGNVEKPERLHQSAEISAVWERLYVMIRNAKGRQDEIDVNNRQHYRFVSFRLVKLLGLKELADAKPGISRRCDLHLLYVMISDLDIYNANKFYEEILNEADKLDGIVCSMESDRIVLLFENEFENVIDAAEQISKIADKNNVKVGIGIGSGIANIFVRGTDDCADISVSGEEAKQTEQMANISINENKYLLTKNAAKRGEISKP